MASELTDTRLLDLVRYCRHDLHDAGLITDDEFAALVIVGSESARQLESYDEATQSAFDAGLEAAADIAETMYDDSRWESGYTNAGLSIAAAIRSRIGQQKEDQGGR